MTLIKPFRALRPAPGRAADVLAPPYDVLSSAEARERAKGKPWSFLHVSKAEIDLDPAIDLYDAAVYAKAAENLQRMIAAGVLVRDATPCYYVYRLTWRGRVETGLAAVASVAAYTDNRIRKHEYTTPAKEDDRVRQIEAVNAQTGPVMLGYPAAPEIDAMLARAAAGDAAVDVTADDGAPPALGDRGRRRRSRRSRARSMRCRRSTSPTAIIARPRPRAWRRRAAAKARTIISSPSSFRSTR